MNTPFKKRESPLSFDSKSTQTAQVAEGDRIKYTATMDKELRKAVKIAAVNKNLQFSQYIEEALREKLQREGY